MFFLHLSLSLYIYIYIDRYVYIHIYIYIYIHISGPIATNLSAPRLWISEGAAQAGS